MSVATAREDDVFREYREQVVAVIRLLQVERVLPADLPLDRVLVVPSRDPRHGDLMTQAPLVLARPSGRGPEDLAHLLAGKLQDHSEIAALNATKQGYLNVTLTHDAWRERLKRLLRAGPDFGRSPTSLGNCHEVARCSVHATRLQDLERTRAKVARDALAAIRAFAGYPVDEVCQELAREQDADCCVATLPSERRDTLFEDSLRFALVSTSEQRLDGLDMPVLAEMSMDNPGFCVQYACARIGSVVRHLAATHPKLAGASVSELAQSDLSPLTRPEEVALIRLICEWPRRVDAAAATCRPDQVATFLRSVAAAFHGCWSRPPPGEKRHLRFIIPQDLAATSASIALLRGVALVLTTGLGLIGIAAREEL